MATFNYEKSRLSAVRLINKFGQAGSVRRTEIVGGVPWDPDSGTPETVNHACTLVVLEYGKNEIDGSLILATDRKVLISTEGLTIEPQTSDELVIGSDVYQIINVMPLSPGGTLLLWEVQARA